MLEVNNLSIILKDRYLVKDLSFTLNKNDKLAIIGEEGNGKSTLLKCILGKCDYAKVSGVINTKNNKIGYLKQSLSEEDLNKTVNNFLFENEEDYYNKINSFYRNLETMNLDDTILDQTIKILSGGEKVKVGILKLLINDYDILFLDEPTNDLDIETLQWLEDFINNSNKPIMYVSHDETLLSNTANAILHLEQIMKKSEPRSTFIKIDYETYVSQRINKIDKQTQVAKLEKREYDRQQEKLRKIIQHVENDQNSISRSDPHGGRLLKKKMHALKSQQKKLDNAPLTKIPDIEEHINFFFEPVSVPNKKKIIDLDIKELKINDRVLSHDIKLEIVGNKHICIIGKNGVGKSTLIKLIYSNLKNRKDLKIGYIPQVYEDILDDYENVLDFVSTSSDIKDITKARMYLGNMRFTREEMNGKIKNLSNGSKVKMFLTKLVLNKCDVLVLDEPTRNVSPLSNPVIRKVLKEYKGTIISVSHDRKYINEVIDELYVLKEEGLFKEYTIN